MSDLRESERLEPSEFVGVRRLGSAHNSEICHQYSVSCSRQNLARFQADFPNLSETLRCSALRETTNWTGKTKTTDRILGRRVV